MRSPQTCTCCNVCWQNVCKARNMYKNPSNSGNWPKNLSCHVGRNVDLWFTCFVIVKELPRTTIMREFSLAWIWSVEFRVNELVRILLCLIIRRSPSNVFVWKHRMTVRPWKRGYLKGVTRQPVAHDVGPIFPENVIELSGNHKHSISPPFLMTFMN